MDIKKKKKNSPYHQNNAHIWRLYFNLRSVLFRSPFNLVKKWMKFLYIKQTALHIPKTANLTSSRVRFKSWSDCEYAFLLDVSERKVEVVDQQLHVGDVADRSAARSLARTIKLAFTFMFLYKRKNRLSHSCFSTKERITFFV